MYFYVYPPNQVYLRIISDNNLINPPLEAKNKTPSASCLKALRAQTVEKKRLHTLGKVCSLVVIRCCCEIGCDERERAADCGKRKIDLAASLRQNFQCLHVFMQQQPTTAVSCGPSEAQKSREYIRTLIPPPPRDCIDPDE